jgi:hypothetical protein
MKSIEMQFEQFRESFYCKNVMVYEDTMVYRTPRGLSESMADDANRVIAKLKLDLVAIPTSLTAKDSFYIKAS